MPKRPKTAPVSDREIVTTRQLKAQRELVFHALSDPGHLAEWWGPKGFRNTFDEFDLRPGGAWRFTMHAPDGIDYPNESDFVEVVRPERIVFRHRSAPEFEMTISLTEKGKGTEIRWRMLFETADECERVKKYAADANEQNLDRLEAELARMG